jgi:hypothetical protein
VSDGKPVDATGDWAAFCSGDYCGWLRSPGGGWEDMIGTVKVDCAAAGKQYLDVSITSLEFGTWTGRLRLDERVLEGTTGQGGACFKCTFEERQRADGIQGCFHGGIYGSPAELLFEFRLTSDWRKHRPEEEQSHGPLRR